MQATGDIYEAARDSEIQDSMLQDVACEKCRAVLGLRCEKAPNGHLLKKNQLILRLAEMSILSESSGQKAKISILKSFPLTFKPNLRRAASAKIPVPSPRPKTSASSGTSTKVFRESDHASLPVTPVFETANFHSWAKDTIQNQQKDIDRLSGTLHRIEREIKTLKDFIKELRASFLSSSGHPYHDSQEEVASLRDEVDQLRQQVHRNIDLLSRKSLEIPTKNLEVIVEDVQRISRKTDEVDALKIELREMKSHIRSVEATQRSIASSWDSEGQAAGLATLDKRKHYGHSEDYTIEEARVLSEPSAKRRKVSASILPLTRVMAPQSRRNRQRTPEQQSTVIDSSSGHGISSPTSAFSNKNMNGTSDSQHKNLSNDLATPNPLTPLTRSKDGRNKLPSASRPVVEICGSMLPPKLLPLRMPLRNGTIFSAGSRNDLLDFTHIEAATGLKRDAYSRYATTEKVSKRSLQYGKSRTMRPSIPVLAESAKSSKYLDKYEQGSRHSLQPRMDQSVANPMVSTEIEPYDGGSDDGPRHPREDSEKENTPDPDQEQSKFDTNTGTPVLTSKYAFSRADRENTLPPIEVDEAFDRENLPKFFKCGTCGNKYRTLQALDYHQEHSICDKGPSDEVPEAFKCGACGKLFRTFTGIKEHVLKKICVSKPGGAETPAILECERCGRSWKDEKESKEHTCISKRKKENRTTIAEKRASPTERKAAISYRERVIRENIEREMNVQ
ncbi:hypothetical protein EG329_010688 [Mollisiaceae sp. DMI_Dod_QoI]|nr:hypothetical protein EG329_010688 [Helotiales sp. DMI_Dod_QoI]